jgi:hypothetical protein
MNDVDILLDAIADVESKGTGGYAAKNTKSSASGKYQFMWSQWGNKIREFAKNPNLTEEQFRADPQLQEQYARHYVENVLTPEAKKLQTRHGSKFKPREVMDLEDAQTLIHFQGYPGSARYLKTGETKNLENNKSVKEYLERTREFRNKARGVNMAAKPNKPVEEEVIDLGGEEPAQAPETTSQLGAAARGLARGVTFDFADEITAALESALTGKTYEQAVKESREAYETAAKEYPKTTFGATLVGGAATTLIPGVGQLGMGARVAGAVSKANQLRTQLQAAKAAGDALTIAKLTPLVAEATKVAAKEVAKGSAKAGAITGGVTGLGAAEDITNLPETALSVGTGAVTGAGLGYAVPRAISAISQTKAGQAAGEALGKAGEAVKERLKSKRWQIPEFAAQPEKQARVDELVQQGKSQGLTDRQILNSIATEFEEIPVTSLESAFKETGVKGALKRVIAGSQEAAEFIDRPEQLERAERARVGTTAEMSRLERGVQKTQEELGQLAKTKEELKYTAGQDVDRIKNELVDLTEQYKNATDDAARANLEGKIEYAKEKLRLNTGINQKRQKLKQLEDIEKQNAQSVATELDKLQKTRSAEQLNNVNKLRDDLNDQVQQLAQQRTALVNTLDNPKTHSATDKDLATYQQIMKDIEQAAIDAGLSNKWMEIEAQAFSDDFHINAVNKTIQYRKDIAKWNKAYDDLKYNSINGLTEGDAKYRPVNRADRTLFLPNGELKEKPQPPINPLMQFAKSASGESKSEATKGDLLSALLTANKRISSAQMGTPAAAIKRQVAEIIQERMKEISPEAYAIQRQLAKTRANVSTIEKSPFFTAKTVPITGRTGRVASAPQKFIKTELPDLTKESADYKKILKQIGVNIDEIEKTIDLNRKARASESTQVIPERRLELMQGAKQAEDELARNAARMEQQNLQQQLLEQRLASEQQQRLNEIRKTLRTEKRLTKDQLRNLTLEEQRIQENLLRLNRRMKQVGETESELVSTLREVEGVPASIRDVGQAAVIGAKGEVPFSIGKVLLPSPKARIQFVNRIKNRFQNPSLTSAARVAMERPITMEVVRSLAMTHKVPEPDLMKEFEDAGIQVEMEAKELPVEMKSQPVQSRVERDRFGNYVVRYNDPSIEDEFFTPEQWEQVRAQYE